MSQLIARLLLTVFLVPLTILFASMVTVLSYQSYRWLGLPYGRFYSRDLVVAVVAGLSSWAFFAGCWVVIWRRGVRWTDARKRWTLLWPFISLLAAVLNGIAFGQINDDLGCFFFAISPQIIWVVGTVLIWRETDAERKLRQQSAHVDVLTCPTCGYNLTGLSEARCPECGAKFTLNDLYANQPSRATAAMEQEVGR